MTTSPPLLASCDRVVFLGPDGCLTSTHAGLVADPAYAELVLRAMARHPEDRPATMEQVAATLGNLTLPAPAPIGLGAGPYKG